MERPDNFGDFAGLLERWAPSEVREAAEAVEALIAHPGYIAILRLLKAREDYWLNLLLRGKPPENRAVADQTIGVLQGLRETLGTASAIRYAGHLSRVQAEQSDPAEPGEERP